jgi:hypothetical protein
MKTLDLSPRMIGKTIRVESERLRIEGMLEALTVTSKTDYDPMIFPPEPPETRIEALSVEIDGSTLRLTGDEQLTIIDR